MSGAQIHVRLFRDSFNTPWGFRLQGGRDINQPLSIQRVFSNSPAEGELQRGDVILLIGDKRAQDLTHKQAQDLIKFGGGQINLVIQRPPSVQVAPLTPRPHHVQAPTFRPQPQQPPMPSPGGQSYGFTPKKVTLSRLGGGGPSFGSDYTSVPVQRGYTPMSAVVQQQEQQSPGGGHQMLNRVQESLDNIILSPRTPEPPYQSSAPFYQQQQQQPSHQPPTYQGYIPTSARIDMQQQQQQQQQQLQYSQGEDDYPIDPVWERRKLFMEKPTTKAGPPPKGPKPRRVPGPSYPVKTPAFGIDYAAPKQRGHAQHTWQPGPPAAPPMAQAPPHIHPQGPAEGGAAPWRDTLKTTGVKPWDKDLQYTAESAPPPAPSAPRYQPPSGPGGSFQPPGPDEQGSGPKVVHLQYNSPMGLYSNQNIQETFQGQTKAMASQGALTPQQQQQQQGQPGKQGERDWNQSSVYRMIKEQETRRTTTTSTSFSPSVPVGHQQQSYRRVPAPDDEVGISDF